MRPLISHLPLTACALATALLVSACGGGDASAPPTVIGTSGFAVDGYIHGATVVCDSNGNGTSDTGEATALTDSAGFFKFAAPCAAGLVLTGGTNTDTKLPFVGKLKAPATSTMVTPLTTLLAEGMTTDQINTALGLPSGTDVKTLDPARKIAGELQNADLFRKTLVVQQVLQKTAESLAALAGSNDVAAMYSQAAAAMSEAMRANPASVLVSGGAVSESAVSAVVKAAATRVSTGVNADSLAQVMASSIAAQAKLILDATNAQSITDVTKVQQSSNAVKTFVTTHKAALSGPPTDATVALKNQLLEQIGTPPSPPPPTSGTVLLSFDEANPVFTGMGAFGDGAPSVAAAPSGGSGSALKLDRTGAQNFGGTYFNVPVIPFTSDRKTITARVYATRANAVVYLKVEGGGKSTELPATVTAANTWQTLTWNLSAVDAATSYTVMVFSADTDVANVGAQSYWVDDIVLAPASQAPTSCATSTEQCISFSEANAGGHGFGDLVSSDVIADPDVATNKLLKIVKGPSSAAWAGATVFTSTAGDADKTIRTLPTFGLNSSKSVTVRVKSGAAVGTKIGLKLENALNPAVFVTTEAITTKQNEWETLTFNFANLTKGTFDSNATYNMASLFPAFSENGGASPALTANTTFYFDELKYVMPTTTPPVVTGTVVANFDTAIPVVRGPDSGGTGFITDKDIPAGGGTGKVLGLTRSGGQPWALNVLEATVPFTADRKTLSARVYSPTAGIPMKIKIEAGGSDTGEVASNEAVVVGWQTLTWTFSAADPSKNYNLIVLLPNIGTVDAAPGKTYYYDDITLLPAAVAPPPTQGDKVVSDFDTVVPVVRGPDSGGTGFITDTDIPAGGGTGKVLGLTRSGGQPWALNVLEATVPFTADRKTLSARVYSPTAGIPMKIKIEAGGSDTGEVASNEAVVVGWQTLTWTFSAADPSKNYNVIVLLPNIGTVDAAPGKTYYYDDIKLLAAAAGGGGGGNGGGTTPPGADMGSGGLQTLTVANGDVKTGDGGNTMFVAGEGLFSVNYVGSAEPTPPNNLAAWPNAKSSNFGGVTGISGGSIGYFQDDVNLSNSSQKVDEGGWVAGTAIAPNGVPNFFRYFVLKGAVSNDAYMGLYANAPNNGTVNVSSFSKIKLKVWGPGPMFERSFNPVLQITLTGPKVAGCTTGSGGSEITQNLTANLKNGAGGFYTMPLSGFTVKGLCGTDSSAANVLSNLARVVVTVPGTSFNRTEIDGGNYATGLNLGPIGFTNR